MNTSAKYLSFLENLSPELKNYVIETGVILTPILNDIHAIKPTTKNYYGEYMEILGNTKQVKILALALIYAGANVDGVNDAVNILTAN
jgi:hypothetical protein